MKDEVERPTVLRDDQLFPQKDDKPRAERLEQLGSIRGKTLEVYYYLVDNPGEQGVREIQRALDYNSASVAAYHLNRLYEYNLVDKTEQGKYFIEGDPIKLGALEDHIRVAGILIPRIAIYGLQALISLIIAIVLFVSDADPLVWFLFVTIVNAVVLLKAVLDSRKISDKLQIGTH